LSCTPQTETIEFESGGGSVTLKEGGYKDLGEIVVNSEEAFQLTIHKSNPAYPLKNLSVSLPKSISFVGGTFPGENGSCQKTFPEQSCVLDLIFQPTKKGVFQESVAISFKTPLGNENLNHSLFGRSGDVGRLKILDLSKLNAGINEIGSEVNVKLAIQNQGELSAIVTETQNFGDKLTFLGGKYPGIGGTCTSIISANQICDVVIAVDASIGAYISELLEIRYRNPQTNTRLAIPIEAIIAEIAGSINYPLQSDLLFSDLPIGNAESTSITVRNNGFDNSIIQGFSTGDPSLTITKIDCPVGTNFAVNETCNIQVKFSPTVQGNLNSYIRTSFYNGRENKVSDLSVSGKGILPGKLDVPLTAYDFGDIAVNGNTQSNIFVLENIGDFQITNLSITNNTTHFRITNGGSIPNSLLPGSSLFLNVVFEPQSIGVFTESLEIQFNNGQTDVDQLLLLEGEGKTAAFLEISELSNDRFNFDSRLIGNDHFETITLKNIGTATATAIDLNITSIPSPYQIDSTTCDTDLTANESCELNLKFSPSSNTEYLATDLTINYDNSIESTELTWQLFGRGGSTGTVSILRTSSLTEITVPIDMNTIDISVENFFRRTLSIRNDGNFTIRGDSLLLDGDEISPYSIENNNCESTITSGQTCTFILVFNPTSAGTFDDALIQFNYTDTVNNLSFQEEIDITGIGASIPVVTGRFEGAEQGDEEEGLSSSFVYPPQVINGPGATEIVTFSNDGSSAATNLQIFGNIENNNDCHSIQSTTCNEGSSLNPGEECTITLLFAPQSTCSITETLSVSFDNTSPSTFNRTVNGVGTSPASLKIFPIDLDTNPEQDPMKWDFKLIDIGESFQQTFRIENNGGYEASNLRFRFLNSKYELDFTSNRTDLDDTTIELTWNDVSYNFDNSFTEFEIFRKGEGEFYNFNSPIATISRNVGMPHNYIDTVSAGIEYEYLIRVKTEKRPYEISANPCLNNSSLLSTSSCNITIRFTPIIPLTSYEDTLTIHYFDGVQNQNTTQDTTGQGQAPPSTHKGWKSIYATGNSINDYTNTADNDRVVEISWYDMTSTFDPNFSSYYIFRKEIDQTFDYTTPYSEVSRKIGSTHKFTDTNTAPSKAYIYQIRPSLNKSASIVVNPLNGTQNQINWPDIADAFDSTFTNYKIYRKLSGTEFNFSSALTSFTRNIGGAHSYTDTHDGNSYEYIVRPDFSGAPSRTEEDFSDLRIISPPNNMALIHKYQANREICEIAKGFDIDDHHLGCEFYGYGNREGYLGWSYDLLVDKFELSLNESAGVFTNNFGRVPYLGSNLSQYEANQSCYNSSEVIINGLTDSFKKRLLSRQEWTFAAEWSQELLGTVINAYEVNTSNTPQYCHTSTQAILPRASSSSSFCKSRFGIYDLIGGSFEFVLDLVESGSGEVLDVDPFLLPSDSSRGVKLIKPDITIEGLTLHGTFDFDETQDSAEELRCLSPIFGLYFQKVNNACPNGTIELTSNEDSQIGSDFYFPPDEDTSGILTPIVGGQFGSLFGGSSAGIYSTFWLPATSSGAAARCGAAISYPDE
jgi:hypothetical protein